MAARISDLGRIYGRCIYGGLENFTSEALAIAAEHDPRPMAQALARMDWLDQDDGRVDFLQTRDLIADTQVSLWPDSNTKPQLHYGILDLVLSLAMPDSAPSPVVVWVEVKIDALETMRVVDDDLVGQAQVYLDHRASLPDRPRLMVLGKTSLRDDVPFMPWSMLVDAVAGTSEPDERWRDLLMFLRERFIANPPDTATGEELLPWAVNILWGVQGRLKELWGTVRPPLWWTQEGQMKTHVQASLKRDGHLATSGGPLRYGILLREGQRFGTVRVVTDSGPQWRSDRTVIQSDPDVMRLPARWDRPNRSETALECTRPFDTKAPDSDVVDWLHDCFDELARYKVIECFRRPGPPASV